MDRFKTPKISAAKLREYLIENKVYAAIHWKQLNKGFNSGDDDAIGLSSRILTIPLDQRYTIDDVDRVVKLLADFYQ